MPKQEGHLDIVKLLIDEVADTKWIHDASVWQQDFLHPSGFWFLTRRVKCLHCKKGPSWAVYNSTRQPDTRDLLVLQNKRQYTHYVQ